MDSTFPLPTLGARSGAGGSPAGPGRPDLPDPDPRVDVVAIAMDDLRGRGRPGDGRLVREVLTFGAIGIVSTLAYAALYLVLRGWLDAAAANAVALVATAIGNTAANRRLTFGVRGRASVVRDQVAGLVALGIALAMTTAAIGFLDLAVPDASRALELAVLVATNAAATITRFVLLRTWISRAPRPRLVPASIERTVR
jgi:putative flippase GtrA